MRGVTFLLQTFSFMLTCPALTAAAFAQLSAALNAEIQELRDVAQQRYHDEAMPGTARPLLQRAEQRGQLREQVEQLKAQWETSAEVKPLVNLHLLNHGPLRAEPGARLIRHIEGVTMKAAAQALAVDAKQIRAWLETGELKGYRPTGGPWKIPYAEILALVKRRKKT